MINSKNRIAIFALLIMSLSFALLGPCAASRTGIDPRRETEMGREAAAVIDRESKLVNDPKILERVNKIGQEIARVANEQRVEATYGSPEICRFDYKFKVIENEEINAFSLPGGHIYVNIGLLNYVKSDHELAAVLAHEIAHSAHHHMVYLLKEQSRMDGQIAIALLAGVLSKVDASNLSHLLIGAQLVKIARVSGYGQKAELDADSTAVHYMAAANYNPVACVTFLERLAHDSTMESSIPLGIIQTHPPTRLRIRNAMTQIEALGLPINRRAVVDSAKAVIETTVVNGAPIACVKLDENVLFEPAPIEGVITSEARAQEAASRVNEILQTMPKLYEIRIGADNRSVIVKGKQVLIVTNEDSMLLGKPAEEIAKNAADVIRKAVWRDFLASIY